MKWLLSLLYFTTITASSQVDKPLLEKLKITQGQLKGKSFNDIPNPGLELTIRARKPPLNTGKNRPPIELIVPERERPGPGRIPNVAPRFEANPRIINANEQGMVIALPQDNMPCVVPNMKLFKTMPGVNDKTMAENQKLFKLLQPKPKS